MVKPSQEQRELAAMVLIDAISGIYPDDDITVDKKVIDAIHTAIVVLREDATNATN